MSALLVQTGESLGYTFTIDGPPVGKARPRFVRATGRAFTPAVTVRAENRILLAWDDAHQPRLDDVPVALTVTAVLCRPRAHIRKVGGLSAAGQRSTHPTKKPDVDNVLKLVCDALNGYAWRDDAQIVQATVRKRWAGAGETEHLVVSIREETP